MSVISSLMTGIVTEWRTPSRGIAALTGLRGCTARHLPVLVVCFIRQVSLSYKYESEQKLGLDTDRAAQRTLARFLEFGHDNGVSVIPVYDTGPDAAEVMAESAAMHGVSRVLIGTSRKGIYLGGHSSGPRREETEA
jgi:hypothetical protein